MLTERQFGHSLECCMQSKLDVEKLLIYPQDNHFSFILLWFFQAWCPVAVPGVLWCGSPFTSSQGFPLSILKHPTAPFSSILHLWILMCSYGAAVGWTTATCPKVWMISCYKWCVFWMIFFLLFALILNSSYWCQPAPLTPTQWNCDAFWIQILWGHQAAHRSTLSHTCSPEICNHCLKV